MANKRGHRYTLTQTDACRAKIKTSQLINRLTAHAMGEIELQPTQVRSIEILLNKTLANLVSQEIKQENTNYVARLPSPAKDADSWLASVRPTEAPGQAKGSSQSPSKAKH